MREKDDKFYERPPAYVSRGTLAHELDCAESTVDEMIKRGILPKPLRLSSGCVRWCWDDVVMALASLKEAAGVTDSDPYLSGVKNVTEIAARGH
jgi:predicted DNA-binding transcriptional regulator AlpA